MKRFITGAQPEIPYAGNKVTIRAKRNEHRIVSDMLANAGCGGSALDVGCGEGSYIDILLQENRRVVGIDRRVGSLKRTRSEYPDVEAVLADIKQIPFKPESFDILLCIDTLQYLNEESRQLAVENFAKLLKPGGTMIMDIKNKWSPAYRLKRFRDSSLVSYYSLGNISRILRGKVGNIQTKGVFFPKFISPIIVLKAKKRC